jgi:hypothetical protein
MERVFQNLAAINAMCNQSINQSHTLPVPSDFSQTFLSIHARSCHNCDTLTTHRACAVPELNNRILAHEIQTSKYSNQLYNITFCTMHTARVKTFSKWNLEFFWDASRSLASIYWHLRDFDDRRNKFLWNIRAGPPGDSEWGTSQKTVNILNLDYISRRKYSW